MLRKDISSTIFKSLVWRDLRLNPGLLGHWRTLYPQGERKQLPKRFKHVQCELFDLEKGQEYKYNSSLMLLYFSKPMSGRSSKTKWFLNWTWTGIYWLVITPKKQLLFRRMGNIYIYIYIYLYANFIKHNRHFMPSYFLLGPFEFPYYFYRIRGELI